MRTICLALSLGVLWTGLSGHFSALILGLGLATVLLSVWLAGRMGLVDREGLPVHTFGRIVPYGLWLLRDVLVCNLKVGRIILSREAKIDPALVDVADHQSSDLGRALFGNSLTLTPGTVTVESDGEIMRVHSLVRASGEELHAGMRARRVARVDSGGGA